MTSRLAQVGTIPHPVGGVSNHVWRLCHQLPAPCALFDMHPGDPKYGLPPDAIRREAPEPKILRLPWLLGQLARRGHEFDLVHIHLSTLDKLGAFLPLLLLPGRGFKVVATLHHGDQAAVFGRMAWPLRKSATMAIRRLDGLVAFTPPQRSFYERLGVRAERILDASSYIRPPRGLANFQDPIPGLEALKAKGAFIAVASGFATEIYQHEVAIEAVDQLRATRDAHLFICLYGRISKPYLKRVEDMAAARPHVTLLWGLELPAFLELLGGSDVYLRPTAVDSFGIAVADAINEGTPVIASDVCPRYPGTQIYPAGDTAALQRTLAALAAQKGGRIDPPMELPEDASVQLTRWYDRLLNASAPA